MLLELSEAKSWKIGLGTRLNLTKVLGDLQWQSGLHCSQSPPEAVCNLLNYH